ncbi:MAG TPA: histidine kinase, partial [Blastocatellia bacterium]|nr:histidine kinase [Blastocatellia bacterium]
RGVSAFEEMDRAVALAPDSMEVRSLRAYAGLYTPSSAGRDPQAVQDFSYMIDRTRASGGTNEELTSLFLTFGELYYKMGAWSDAAATWQKVVDLAPGSSLAATARERLSILNDNRGPELGSTTSLAGFFGFLIGVAIFGLLCGRLSNDLLKNKRKRSRTAASLIVASIGLVWNAANLAGIVLVAVGASHPQALIRLAAIPRQDLYLIPALAPIPLGMLLAYRFHKATFMDIVLKHGGRLLIILALSVINARIWGGLLVFGDYHLNSTIRPIVLTGTWLLVFALYLPLRRVLDRAVDRYLLKRRDYSRIVRSLNERLRGATDEQSIELLICEAVKEAFAAQSVEFLLAQDELAQSTAAELESMHRDVVLTRQVASENLYRKLDDRGCVLVAQLRSGAELIGVLLIGARAYGQSYLSEELSALAALTAQAAPMIENTRLHEVRRRQEIAEQELRKLATQAELKALRAQIDPHFFFNSLNSVAALISDDPESAERLIEDISELFRHAFRPNREFVTLRQEMELVETYLQIESARLGDRLKIEKEIAPEAQDLKIPALSIQPLVENAVKHSISKSTAGGRLVVSAGVKDECLTICVSDSGTGIQPLDHNTFSGGIGLQNVDARLTALYGEAARLKIASDPGFGTEVSFAIPLAHCKGDSQVAIAHL